MDLGKSGWLRTLLTEEVGAYLPTPSERLLATLPSGLSVRGRARSYVRTVLKESGLLYGAPATRQPPRPGALPEETLFFAVIRTLVRCALDLSLLLEAPSAAKREQLLALFAALVDLGQDAEEILYRARSREEDPVSRRTWARVEEKLAARAMSLAGDPAYGLVLHNGAVYADANVFLRHALALFSRGTLRAAEIRRRNRVAAHQKMILVEVLTALTRAERPPSYPVRRAILRQIEDLELPSDLEDALRGRVKRAFERAPELSSMVRGVRSADLRRFLVEQTLLASIADGRRSPTELRFIQALAKALKISPEALSRCELSVAEFYAKHRSVVDVFTVAAGAEILGQDAIDEVQGVVEKNLSRLMQEVRETGELSVLLAKAVRGHKLNEEEKRKMREQLIDIAKAIPALAIFAAPGGLFLLIALAKVLPFNLLPSSFQEDAEPGE